MLLPALLLAILLPCSAQDWGLQAPVIYLNSEVLTRSQVVLPVGAQFTLACEGAASGSVSWSTSAILRKSSQGRSLSVKSSAAEHTGTYTCVELIQNQTLSSQVHVFVKDPANLFVIPRNPDKMKEGADLLVGCMLTDPSATDLTLGLANGSALPSDLNYTADPRRGVVIRRARTHHSGRYVCSARIGGVERKSKSILVDVFPRQPRPSVSLETEEYVRIVGEPLQITCVTSNPSHFFNVSWKHSSLKALKVSTSHKYRKWMFINSTVSVPAVSHADTGTFTCTAFNEDGANATSARLTVVDGPYLRLQTLSSPPSSPLSSPVSSPPPNVSADEETGGKETGGKVPRGWMVEVREGEDLELRVQIEAYPPVLSMLWETPTSLNSSARDQTFTGHNHRFESRLQVRRLRRGDGGDYLLHYKSKHINNSVHFRVRMLREPSALISLGNSSSLTCIATGYRVPTILWYQCPGIRDSCGDNHTLLVQPRLETTYSEVREEAQSQVDLLSTADNVTVECVASNDYGTSRAVFVSHVAAASARVMPQLFSPTLIGASSAAGVLLLLLLFVLYKYRQKPKYEIRWKIIETSDGNNYSFIDPTQLPYNEQWEFPRDRLRLGSVLGAGAFGKVVEATAYGLGNQDNVTRVAVKMLKPSAHSEEREALMSELKILSHLGHHDNIVNLLGACTRGGPMLMITEYCSHGDLLNFLRGRAEDFMDAILSSPEVLEDREQYKNMAVHQGRIRSDSGIDCSDSDHYLDMHPVGSPQPHGPLVDQGGEGQTESWSLDVGYLLILSCQVAQGMEFLASRNCIHRDIAARNVLLTEQGVAKICDFGLARDVMNDSNYVVKGNARLPVKWMAPESIFDCVYTVQSDVWSYGILLWEIFSLGKSPYPNVVVDTGFYKMIKNGRHMSRPDFSPPEMYSIMAQCWSLDPTDRPTFTTIGQLIQDLLPQQTHQPYSNLQATLQGKGEEEEVEEEEEEEEEGQPTKCCEEDCNRQTASHEEEEQPLMKSNNNYQVC